MELLWILLGLVIFAIVMSVLVIVHEGGHFLVAKKAGILCHEFAVGMGPVIYQKKKGETVYSIRALPIGGYVSMAGEEVEENILKDVKQVKLVIKNDIVEKIIVNLENPKYKDLPAYDIVKYDLIGTRDALSDELFIEVKDGEGTIRYTVARDCLVNFEKKTEIQIAPYDRNFVNKPWLNRFLSVFAGPFMNFVLAVVIFFIIGLCTGYADTSSTTIGATTAVSGSNNTLVAGDTLTYINNDELSDWASISKALNKIAQGGSNFTPQIKVTTEDGKVVVINPSVFVYSIELPFKVDGTNEAIVGSYSSASSNEQSKVYVAGLREGDRIVKITAEKTSEVLINPTKADILAFFNKEELQKEQNVVITVERNGTTVESSPIEVYDKDILDTQSVPATKVQLGIEADTKVDFVKLLYMPFVQAADAFTLIFKTLGAIFTSDAVGVDDLSGPVGIFDLFKNAAQQDEALLVILNWTAILSVNLCFVNLLPLPALDGGRISFMLYEGITRKKPNAKVENIIHTIGFLLLMGLMLFVTFNDVLRCVGIK